MLHLLTSTVLPASAAQEEVSVGAACIGHLLLTESPLGHGDLQFPQLTTDLSSAASLGKEVGRDGPTKHGPLQGFLGFFEIANSAKLMVQVLHVSDLEFLLDIIFDSEVILTVTP